MRSNFELLFEIVVTVLVNICEWFLELINNWRIVTSVKFTKLFFVRLQFGLCCCTEPDYEFEKELNDADAYEKETAEFECEVNDEEAPVQWFREDKVNSPVSPA